MSGFIPEEKIAEILNTADIVDIISESVILKKAGVSFKGLCPFHSEKTPSFTVTSEKKMFYCFGCGTGGNVISFLMKQSGMTFPEAAKMLANRYGIEIQTASMTPEQKMLIGERESLLELNNDVMKFFRYNLLQTDNGSIARKYLKNRGISDEIIKRFCLGFVPDGWDNLVKFLRTKNIKRSIVEKSGLVVKKDNSGYYDRLIFPIFDIGMKIIGFGGRVLDDSQPKYLNSPETLVYNKSRSLYGLHLGKSKCRQTDTVFIVEGYFDLIALCQHGIENTVASLGTALTVEHVRMLKGYASKMILVYDSDTAGIEAAKRSIPIFSSEGVEAKILVLPEGYDPDSFIFEFGTEKFQKKAKEAVGAILFLIQMAINKHGFSVDGKIQIIQDMIEPIAKVTDGVIRSLYIKELAEKISVNEVAILHKIKENIKAPLDFAENLYVVENTKKDLLKKDLLKKDLLKKDLLKNMDRMEKKIISMVLQFPDSLRKITQYNVFDFFHDKQLKSIGEKLLEISLLDNKTKNCFDISFIIEQFKDKSEILLQRDIVISLAVGGEVLENEKWDYQSCENLISQFLAIRDRNDNSLLQRIKVAEENNDDVLLMQLLSEKQIQSSKRLETGNLKKKVGGD